MTTLRRHQKAFLAATAVSTLLLTAACGGSDDADTTGGSTSSTSEPAADEGAGTDAAETSGEYTDGTYEGSGSYANPGGTSSVSVEVTLEGGTVSDVTVSPEASGTSGQFQQKFAGGIADEVVGRSIDDLDVSKVAGSSLTSGGFNEAIEQIKAEAQA